MSAKVQARASSIVLRAGSKRRGQDGCADPVDRRASRCNEARPDKSLAGCFRGVAPREHRPRGGPCVRDAVDPAGQRGSSQSRPGWRRTSVRSTGGCRELPGALRSGHQVGRAGRGPRYRRGNGCGACRAASHVRPRRTEAPGRRLGTAGGWPSADDPLPQSSQLIPPSNHLAPSDPATPGTPVSLC